MKKTLYLFILLLLTAAGQLQAQTWTQVDRIDFTTMAAGLDYPTGGTPYYDDAAQSTGWNGFINTDVGKYLAYLTGGPAGSNTLGDVFCKTYTGLIVGRTYRYSYKSMNMSTPANALLALKLDGTVVTPPASPATNFGTFSRTPYYQFTATNTSHTICITNSRNETAGNDFGFSEILLEIVTLPISGTVFNDSNGDTTPNGTGMAGVTVTLYAADGVTVIATATTNASGNYTFPAQPPGTYYVEVTPPAAYSNVSSTDATPADGRTTVTLAGTTPATGVNFGIALESGCSNNPVTETYSSFTATSANSTATISGTAITGAVTVSNIMDGTSGFSGQNFTFGASSFNGIRTGYNSTVTHTFSQPVKDPILVLASLGGNGSGFRDIIRIVQFNDNFTVLDQYDSFTPGQGASVSTLNIDLAAKTIAGSEDGVIIRFSGVFTSISYTSFAVFEDTVAGYQNGNQAPVYSTNSQRAGEEYFLAWQLQCYLGRCYKPAVTSGTNFPSKHGITSLGRAGANNSNWPMVRQSAWTVLEAKTKGFVVNRVPFDNGTGNPVGIPVANFIKGMMVYDSTNNCLKIYNGTIWSCFSTPACP